MMYNNILSTCLMIYWPSCWFLFSSILNNPYIHAFGLLQSVEPVHSEYLITFLQPCIFLVSLSKSLSPPPQLYSHLGSDNPGHSNFQREFSLYLSYQTRVLCRCVFLSIHTISKSNCAPVILPISLYILSQTCFSLTCFWDSVYFQVPFFFHCFIAGTI